MTNKEKREKIKERLIAAPDLSPRIIARAVGCSHTTVIKIRKEMSQAANKSVNNGQRDTQAFDYMNHPIIKSGVIDLAALSVKGLQAVKKPEVLDRMLIENWTSPVYAQRRIRQEKK